MVTIREVTETDLVCLAEYLPRQPPFLHTTKETWERRFKTWWTLNPAFTAQMSRGWILENNTSLAGFIGTVPVKFIVCGEVRTAAAAVTWYVDPSARGLFSIRLLQEFLKQKNVPLFLFNTTNEKLIRILFKNKFIECKLPRFHVKYFSILSIKKGVFILGAYSPRITKFLESKGIKKFRNGIYRIEQKFGSFLDAVSPAKFSPRLSTVLDKDYTTSDCHTCDESFLKLWESTKSRCDVTLSRDTKTMNWIYFQSIEPSQRVVIQCRRNQDDSLAGYLVFDINRKKPSETGVMKLMDICIENNDPRVMTSLIHYASAMGKQHDVAILELWADDEETERYLKRNFLLRSASYRNNYYRFSDSLMAHHKSLTICPTMIAPPRGIDHF